MVGRLAAAGFLAALLCAAFPTVLFEGRTFSSAAWLPGALPTGPVGVFGPPDGAAPVRDLEGATWVDEPAPYLVHRGLAAGQVPLWNDAEGLGIPLLGNPNMGALSPLQLLVNLFPSSGMQDFAWLFRVFLVGFFTFGFARELGVGAPSSMAAAVALMLSGQTVEWIEHHPLNTDVFVPAALWAALALRRTGDRGVAWLALAVAAGLLGVKPQSAIMAGVFGLSWLLAAAADRSDVAAEGEVAAQEVPLHRQVAGWVAGVTLGAGIAAIALVPFAETYEQASGLVRAGRTTQSQWTLPLQSLSSLGGSLAEKLQYLPTGGAAPPAESTPRGLPYAGLTVVVGAALGFWNTRRSWLTRALALTVGLEVLRIHGLLPVSLGDVPIFGSINYVKYCFPLYFALALLVARGLDSLPFPGTLLGLALVVAEMLWLVPRTWAERVDVFAPAPWTVELKRLSDERPGRFSGPVELAPPLVSSAMGVRDLRSIDVLTPRDTYDFVSRLISPSRGVTWILADPTPLLAATGPGSNLADLRWIASAEPLRVEELPEAVRESTTSRRLVRLFGALDRQAIETRRLGGGVHDGGRDRRFHWTCETPCRFDFEFPSLPAHFVAGIASPEPVSLRVRLGTDGGEAPLTHVPAGTPWHDLWMDAGTAAGAPGTIVLEIDSEAASLVFVGGIGPAPSAEEEATREGNELAYRVGAFERLELRWKDEIAHLYENVAALGEAVFAERIVSVADRDAAFACVAQHPGEAVACVPRDALPARDLPPGGPAVVEIAGSEPGSLRLRTGSEKKNLLLLSRLFDPGWHAPVDGSPAPLLPANGALLALAVPEGAHDVEIYYSPGSLGLGLALSLLSLALLVGLLWARPSRPQAV